MKRYLISFTRYSVFFLVSSLFTVGVLALSSGIAQETADRWTVLPSDDGHFADRAIMLQKHFSRLSAARNLQRQVDLARIRNESDWEQYKSRLLRDYQISLGVPFPEKTPLQPETVRILDRGSYRIENMMYQSMPGIYVPANLYVPQTGTGPFPGILFSCGHSNIAGKGGTTYHSAALGLVQKGYVVLLYDAIGQGERFQYLKPDGKPVVEACTVEHTYMANELFLSDRHLMAVRMWDGIRGIDYLLTRPEVDPERIGLTGNSGGGTLTIHLTPMEPRIKVAVPVGTVYNADLSLGGGSASDGEQNLPLLVPHGISHAELMMLAYPRPYRLIIESQGGTLRSTRTCFVQAHHLYEELGQGEKMTFVETEWPHGYFQAMREPMYQWFGKWFYGREDDHAEPEIKTEEVETLWSTTKGQVLAEKGKSILQWNAEQTDTQFTQRTVPGTAQELSTLRKALLDDIRPVLNNPVYKAPSVVRSLGTIDTAGIIIEKLALYTEADIYLPCLLFKPSRKDTYPVLLIADSEGNTADVRRLALRYAAKGFGVCAVELRGYGETRLPPGERDVRGGYTSRLLGVEAAAAYDGLKLGRSVFAMRIYDILCSVKYLAGRADVIPGVAVIGRNSCGPLTLYAAALDETISGVLLDNSLAAFRELLNHGMTAWHFADHLPRVLRSHDLPQVAAIIAPRPVQILRLLDNQKNPVTVENSSRLYQFTRDCFTKQNTPNQFQIGDYQSEQERSTKYQAWVSRVFPGK